MDELLFEAEPLGRGGGCGCAKCSSELEWELPPAVADKRPRAPSCTTQMPAEVLSCRRQGEEAAKMCLPSAGLKCPPIPELWTSRTVGGVPFWSGASVMAVRGTKKYALRSVKEKDHAQEMTPRAWSNLQTWVGLMGSFGMPIAAIITDGARYCRCIKSPKGACRHDNHGGCTGRTLSNHSFGDAIDIAGVVWKDPALVGSSQKATLMHSWADATDQGQLLRRINGALRLAFATVIDYSDSGHRDHFHVDTNRGAPRAVFGMVAEQYFVLGALKLLGYVDAVKPLGWDRARTGLAAFARRGQMQVPTSSDRAAWRPVVHRLFSCVALGNPAQCKNVP